MPATLRLRATLVVALASVSTASAQSWVATGLAIRTNGAAFREGECVKVSLIALDEVPGPLVPKVSYRFQGSVTVKDQAGQEHTVLQPRAVQRAAGSAIDRLEAGSSVVLDSGFCFGVGSSAGPYDITVEFLAAGGTAASLATCVEFQPARSGETVPANAGCAFAVRGVSRRDDPTLLTLEGRIPEGGVFRLAFLLDDRILYLLEGGLVLSGPGEWSFVVPPLGADATGSLDLLVQDQLAGRSATLARVSLPR